MLILICINTKLKKIKYYSDQSRKCQKWHLILKGIKNIFSFRLSIEGSWGTSATTDIKVSATAVSKS